MVPDIENFSRGVEYEIDEEAMEIRQVWEYGENIPEPIYSRARSDADWLEATGNVLMTFGTVSHVGGIPSADLGLGDLHTRIVEATDDPVPERVFELVLYDSQGGRIQVYRGERIPSLYPQQDGVVRYVKPPNGVGDTLMLSKLSDSVTLQWAAPPVDSHQDAADYYVIYVSNSPENGFAMLDSTGHANATSNGGADTEFYKIVAANTAATSGDEPAP